MQPVSRRLCYRRKGVSRYLLAIVIVILAITNLGVAMAAIIVAATAIMVGRSIRSIASAGMSVASIISVTAGIVTNIKATPDTQSLMSTSINQGAAP
jgi:hypothetical protein